MKISNFTLRNLCIITLLFLVLANIAIAETYTKNSWPTYSGYVISCDGDDTRISCQDSGNGRNHWCNSYGSNGCQAFEGRENYGSPGCLITCKSVQPTSCSDGTPDNQCSSNKPFFCSNGQLIKKSSSCSCPSGEIQRDEGCIAQVCSDGTSHNQCSSAKPLLCSYGLLVNRAQTCGCPDGQTVSGNNCIIQTVLACADGTQNNQCSSSKPLFCLNGNLVNKASSCGCPSGQTASGDNCTSTTQQQISAVSGKLVITDIDVKIDGKKSSISQDEIRREANPGSKVQFKIKVKNNFTVIDNLDIANVVITLTAEGIDNGKDLEEESDEFDLKPQTEKTKTLTLDVPLNVDEDTFSIEITAEGEDEQGEVHESSVSLQLDIEKEKSKLRISDLSLNKERISCDRKLLLNYELLNIGSTDENVYLQIKNENLGIDYSGDSFLIQSDLEENKIISSLALQLGDIILPGDYQLPLKLFSDGIIQDTKTAGLTVSECTSIPTKLVDIGIKTNVTAPSQISIKKEGIISPQIMILIIALALLLLVFFIFVILPWRSEEDEKNESH